MTESIPPIGFVAPEPSELASLFPGYEIHNLIATGGMGAVYCAVQKSLDRTVALKILPMEFSEDAAFCAGFEAEAKAMARLNHPNLISVYDFGEVNGMLYIVMEFVPGKSIFHSAHGVALNVLEAVRLVVGVCNGLSHAHDNGILHRDIKPSNILLTLRAEPKIGDFGLARPFERKSRADEVIYGTPGYTAPEVVNSPDKVDHRADLFSVGVLLHELLTGKLPAADPRPASVICGCDVRLDAIIARATHPLPANRYFSAKEIAAELLILSTARVTGPISHVTGRVSRVNAPISHVTGRVSLVNAPVSRVTGRVSRVTGPVSRVTGPISRVTGPIAKVTGPIAKVAGNARVAGVAGVGAPRPPQPRRATSARLKRKSSSLKWIGPLLAVAIIAYSWHTFANMKPRIEVIDVPTAKPPKIGGSGTDFETAEPPAGFQAPLFPKQAPVPQPKSGTNSKVLVGEPSTGMNSRHTNPAIIPKGAKLFNGKKYFVYKEKCGWNSARDKCAAQLGQLAVIPDEPTQQFLRKLAGGNNLWVGASDENVQGRWDWVDGSAMKYNYFNAEEPNNREGENYLAILGKNSAWADSVESGEGLIKGYICEWPDAL